MRRPNLVLLSLIVSIPAAVAGGCAADNPTSLIILGNTAPGTGCGFTAAEAGPFLFNGVLDVDHATSYIVVPTLMTGATISPGEPETINWVHLRGAHVEITGVNSQDSLAVVEAMGAENTVRDSEDCTGAFDEIGLCSVTVLDAGQIAALRAAPFADGVAIKAEIQVEGELRNNTILSNTFQWQITLCRGCLVTTIDTACMDIADQIGGPACLFGQDRGSICCLVDATNHACFGPP